MFLLVGAALAGAQSFEDLAIAIGPVVFGERLLAEEFELAHVGLELLAEAMQVLADKGSELEIGGSASGLEPGGIGLCGVGERAFQLCQCFLGAGDLEIDLLQFEGALAFDALTEAEEGSESETERHDSGGHGFRLEAP